MSDERVGTLDHPARYGKRACSVYHNSRGYYVKLNGVREKLHGATHWTSLSWVKMRGAVPLEVAPHGDAGVYDEEDAEWQAAIAASLEEHGPAWDPVPAWEPPEAATAHVASAHGAQAAQSAQAAHGAQDTGAQGGATHRADGPSGAVPDRRCVVCMDQPVCMVMKPCAHLIACTDCARTRARSFSNRLEREWDAPLARALFSPHGNPPLLVCGRRSPAAPPVLRLPPHRRHRRARLLLKPRCGRFMESQRESAAGGSGAANLQ